jgi:hypothetical protein
VRQLLKAVCRTDAGCANHPGHFGRSDRSKQPLRRSGKATIVGPAIKATGPPSLGTWCWPRGGRSITMKKVGAAGLADATEGSGDHSDSGQLPDEIQYPSGTRQRGERCLRAEPTRSRRGCPEAGGHRPPAARRDYLRLRFINDLRTWQHLCEREWGAEPPKKGYRPGRKTAGRRKKGER